MKHGDSKTRFHRIWRKMRNRCSNKNNKDYKNYGGRGIKVCKKWKNYLLFKRWSLAHGYREDLEIDRRNNDGDYTPQNCRFVTHKENMRNSRTTKLTEEKVKEIRRLCLVNGLRQCVMTKMFGVSKQTISNIITNKTWIE